jgi:hypothetical protein
MACDKNAQPSRENRMPASRNARMSRIILDVLIAVKA